MNLIFLGAPGAGKGTQSALITKEFGIPQISTGDIIRAAIRDKTELGLQCQQYLDQGNLVPDSLVNGMVEYRLAQADCAVGFLLDGFPRTVQQAETLDGFLQKKGRQIDHVLLIDVPDEILMARITGRRSDPETGKVYHLTHDPPPADVMSRLVHRSDDTPEVFGQRLQEYRNKTALLIPHYEKLGLLRRVNGNQTQAQVEQKILSLLCTNTVYRSSDKT